MESTVYGPIGQAFVDRIRPSLPFAVISRAPIITMMKDRPSGLTIEVTGPDEDDSTPNEILGGAVSQGDTWVTEVMVLVPGFGEQQNDVGEHCIELIHVALVPPEGWQPIATCQSVEKSGGLKRGIHQFGLLFGFTYKFTRFAG